MKDKKEYRKQYYLLNKERIKETAKKNYRNNKDQCLIKVKKYAENNPDKIKIYKQKHRESKKNRAKKFTDLVKKLFGCCKCGYNKNPRALDFHHLYDKKHLVSKMANDGYTIKSIKKEIKKCQILCANCHRKEHYKNKKYGNKKWRIVHDIKLNSFCCICKESNVACLDFHHISNKNNCISALIRSKQINESVILNELNNCIVLCSNCHREHHSVE